jgi:hypothetical protein
VEHSLTRFDVSKRFRVIIEHQIFEHSVSRIRFQEFELDDNLLLSLFILGDLVIKFVFGRLCKDFKYF